MGGPASRTMTFLRITRSLVASALGLGLLGVAACTGSIGDAPDGPGTDQQPLCSESPVFDVAMYRINADQYARAVHDLFGDQVVVDATFPSPLQGYLFSTYTEANPTATAQVRPIMDAAESVAMQVVDLVPACDGDEAACAETYLRELASRAFRRPATDDEVAILTGLYTGARAESDHAEAVGIAVFGLLQMPQFLYLMEEQPTEGTSALTSEEIAQRMAMLYWNGLPDETLLAADLTDPEVRREQTERLVADDKATAAIGGFLYEWMKVKDWRSGEHTPEQQAALLEEMNRLLADALRSPDGMTELLTGTHTYVNSVLEDFYGLPTVSSGPDDWREVDLDPEQRVGILTHPLLMSRFAHGNAASPILRGQFIRVNLLCQTIPAPPAGATDEQSSLTPEDATPREKAQARLDHPTCGSCHRLMDPIGFGFDAFDGAGRFVPEGADVAGEITTHESLTGTFEGVRELGERLADNEDVRACFAKQWVRYALGRTEADAERCSANAFASALTEQSQTLTDLFVNFASSPAFLERAAAPEEDQ